MVAADETGETALGARAQFDGAEGHIADLRGGEFGVGGAGFGQGFELRTAKMILATREGGENDSDAGSGISSGGRFDGVAASLTGTSARLHGRIIGRLGVVW